MNNRIYYHYCSVDTFYNILETGTIRFGNPLNMNDSAEIIWLFLDSKGFKWIDIERTEWHMNDSKWKEHVMVSQATYR